MRYRTYSLADSYHVTMSNRFSTIVTEFLKTKILVNVFLDLKSDVFQNLSRFAEERISMCSTTTFRVSRSSITYLNLRKIDTCNEIFAYIFYRNHNSQSLFGLVVWFSANGSFTYNTVKQSSKLQLTIQKVFHISHLKNDLAARRD